MGKTKKILVTGGSGFIGRHVLPILLEQGYEVHVISTQIRKENQAIDPKVIWHHASLFEMDRTEAIVSQVMPTHLIHFAWYTEPVKYWTSDHNIEWVTASLSLLQSIVKHGAKRIVIAGSCAEYNWDYGFCSENFTPLQPKTLYGVCKNAFRSIFESFIEQHRVSAAWGTIFFLYGPHEHPSRFVSSIIRSILQSKPAKCSHGKQIRDFMHVEDVASAFVSLLESDAQGVVNIGTGIPIAMKTVAEKIAILLGREDLLKTGELNPTHREPPLIVADNRRLTSETDWIPQYTIDSGLRQTIDWWKAHMERNCYDR